MGLLASIASNLGKSGGEYAETLAKISAEKEAREAKDKADIEKEARIEEAWSKHHDIERGEKLADQVVNRQNAIDDRVQGWNHDGETRQAQNKDAIGMLGIKNGYDDNDRVQEHALKREETADQRAYEAPLHEAQLNNARLTGQESQLKLDTEKQLFGLKDKVLNGTTEEQAEALNKIQMLGGKDKTIIKTAKVQFGTSEDGKPIMGDAMYREEGGKVQWINPQEEMKKINPALGMTEEEASALATDATNNEVGARNKVINPFSSEKDNTKEWDEKNAANLVRAKKGMLKDIPDTMKNGDSAHDTTLRVVMMGVNQQGNEKGGMLSNGDYNFGNVRNNNGVGFKEIKTPEAGVEVITDRMNRYADGIKTKSNPTGKPATTLLEFTSIYAPKEDGNDPVAYAKMLSEKMGIGINDPVDLKDPEIQKMATPLIMLQENRPRAEKAFKDPRVMRAIANIGNDSDKKDNDKTPSANAVWNPKTGKIERI